MQLAQPVATPLRSSIGSGTQTSLNGSLLNPPAGAMFARAPSCTLLPTAAPHVAQAPGASLTTSSPAAYPQPGSSTARPISPMRPTPTRISNDPSPAKVLSSGVTRRVSDTTQRAFTGDAHDGSAASRQASAPPTLLQSLHSGASCTPTKIDGKIIHGNTDTSSVPVEKQIVASDKSDAFILALNIFTVVDADCDGYISKLDLWRAMKNEKVVGDFILPGFSGDGPEDDERAIDAATSVFAGAAYGKKRITKQEFADYYHRKAQEAKRVRDRSARLAAEDSVDDLHKRLHCIFDHVDTDSNGIISKLDLISAVQQSATVAAFVLPGQDTRLTDIMSNSAVFDAVDDIFDKIAKGRKRIDVGTFIQHYEEKARPVVSRTISLLRPDRNLERGSKRVLIISPGFGRQLNPRQYALVAQSGFQIEWVNVPNPETPGFPMQHHLSTVQAAIDQYQPDLLACASKGGHYVIALWRSGAWKGATLMLNAHPSLKKLPEGVRVVIAHGGNDELYKRSRDDLDDLISSGSPNMCFLYTAVDSGRVQGASGTRNGDMHNMESLLTLDCLPRLMESAVSPVPVMQMMLSWRSFLGEDRLKAEEWLGYDPETLRRHWASTEQRGMDSQLLYEVPRSSEEFQQVCAVIQSSGREPPFYNGVNPALWPRTVISKIERVENGLQHLGCATPYYESLRRSIEEQGLAFEPGLHTRWAFHGTAAIESICTNPIAGFQPLTSGSRLGSVWGNGTYFARDAKYVFDTGLCPVYPDGSKVMLMCLLMTGMSCIGDSRHRGVLPFTQKPHRYNSSVDSLSSPEIFVMQHPSSAHPAYVITFR